jgi:high-affinity iron transporter
MTRGTLIAAVVVTVLGTAGLLALAVRDTGAQGKGDAAAGQVVYKARCANCHGATGAGDGQLAQKMKDKPKDWTKGDGQKELQGLSDQQVFDVIQKGGPAIGKAKAMLAFPSLKEADVWNLVAYVKSLAKS